MVEEVSLSSLLTPSKTVSFEYPGYADFIIELCHLSREEMIKLRNRCVTRSFNRKTRQPEEEIDSDLFAKEYSKAVIKGWKGLKASYVEELLLVDSDKLKQAGITELPYTQANAETLMRESSDFDAWVVDTVSDLANFSKAKSSR